MTGTDERQRGTRPGGALESSRARITALGVYVPAQVMTNDDLARIVETNDEWIVRRTGIRQRRIAGAAEFTTDLCMSAVNALTERYPVDIQDVDQIIVATTTPDYAFPSVASQLQHRLGLQGAGAFDLNATCAGFVYGLLVANGLITSGMSRKVLVIGGETLTKVTDYTDRNSCILFGDGAGAALVERDDQNPSFLAAHVGADGSGGKHLYRSGISKQMGEMPLQGNGLIVQSGRDVFKWAVKTVPEGVAMLLNKANLTVDDVDWFVPHSANLRIVEAICEKTGLAFDRTLYSLEAYGNTSSATIPLALDAAARAGRIQDGDTVLLYGFGGGLVHAGVLVRWNTLAPRST